MTLSGRVPRIERPALCPMGASPGRSWWGGGIPRRLRRSGHGLLQRVTARIEAPRALAERPRRAGPQRRVAARIVEVPGCAAACRPDGVLQAVLELGVVGVLHLAAHV